MRRLRKLCMAAAVAFSATAAHAHFPAGYDLRVAHFVRADGGLHVYLRLTLPLAVANRLGQKGADGFYEAAPFTLRRIESAHAFYYPDVARMRAEPKALGELIAGGHRIEIEGGEVKPGVESVRVYPKGTVPPFNTLDDARRATEVGDPYPGGAAEVDAAYVMVDTHLFYPHPQAISRFSISSALDNRILGQPEVQNLLIDHRDGRDFVYRAAGLMMTPVEINPSRAFAAMSFFRHGFEHFAFGADHLLFVLCLALGAVAFSTLLWRITGFTLGHALSLTAGFFGYAPAGAWFMPAVEMCIAASIVLAAAAILVRRFQSGVLAWVTVAIGIIHGFGFSFALREMLHLDGPHLALSLAAFNLGIETGQVVFAGAVWAVMQRFAGSVPRWRFGLERAVSGVCVAIAVMWIVDRSQMLMAAAL